LRRETCDDHSLLEQHPYFLDLMQGRMSRERYAAFLSAYAGHMLPLESVLDRGLRNNPFHVYVQPACRLASLAADLSQLGQPWPPANQAATDWCVPRSSSFLVGVLYVHLGSRLGARLIAKQLLANHAIVASCGGSFFSDHDHGFAMWMDFLERLQQNEAEIHVSAAVEGAQAAFGEFRFWLSRAHGGQV